MPNCFGDPRPCKYPGSMHARAGEVDEAHVTKEAEKRGWMEGGLAGPRLFHFISPAQPHKPTTSPTESCLLQKRKRYPRSQPNPAQPIAASSDPSPTIIRRTRFGKACRRTNEPLLGNFLLPCKESPSPRLPVFCQSFPATPKILQVLFAVCSSQFASHWLSATESCQSPG